MNRLRRTVRMPIVTAAAVAVAAAAAPLRLLRHHRQQQRLTINGVKTKVINLYYKWVMALFKQISNTLFNMKKRNRKGRGRERWRAGGSQRNTYIYFPFFDRRMRATVFTVFTLRTVRQERLHFSWISWQARALAHHWTCFVFDFSYSMS